MEFSYTDLVVIGGGPAGMMCAFQASQRGKSVVLLEPNDRLGCNLCNNCDVKTFMANVPGDGRFLYSALSRFSPADTIAFFESNGLPLKTERGNRVFPQSDNANDVANLMASLCRKSGVQVIKTAAKQIIAENGAVVGVMARRRSAQEESPIRSPARPETAMLLPKTWAIRSRRCARLSSRWKVRMTSAPKCRASPRRT